MPTLNIPLKLAILQSPWRTQIAFAFHVGICETRMSRLVHGWVTPFPDECIRIAAALDVPASTLFPSEKPQADPATSSDRIHL